MARHSIAAGKPRTNVSAETMDARALREMARRLNFLMGSRGEDLTWLGRRLGIHSLIRVRALTNGNTVPSEAEKNAIDALLAEDGA